jgi:hypothetical protein
MRCFSCATENRTGTRFCVKCGQRLDRSCSACGASYTEGDEVGVTGLRARAGVITGEAAVSVGAVGQGMVAGDLVNTASRVPWLERVSAARGMRPAQREASTAMPA